MNINEMKEEYENFSVQYKNRNNIWNNDQDLTKCISEYLKIDLSIVDIQDILSKNGIETEERLMFCDDFDIMLEIGEEKERLCITKENDVLWYTDNFNEVDNRELIDS